MNHTGNDAFKGQPNGAVTSARHAHIRLIGSATGQNHLVSGRHMGVGAQKGHHLAVEPVPHQLFFGCRFGVKIDKNWALDALDELKGLLVGTIIGSHKSSPLQIDDRQGQVFFCNRDDARSWSATRKIGRPQHSRLTVEINADVALIPNVIACGDDVNAQIKKPLGDFWRDAPTTSAVFTVDDDEIRTIGGLQVGQQLFKSRSPWRPHQVANVEHFDHLAISVERISLMAVTLI